MKLDQGLTLNNLKFDIILYADDIFLISDTKVGLKKQLDLIEHFGIKNEIKFNPQKKTLIIYMERKTIPNDNINKDHIEKRKKLALINLGNLKPWV